MPAKAPRGTTRLAIFAWAFLIWVLITWTMTTEQLAVGVVIAALVALLAAPLGPVPGPWRLLEPRRLGRLIGLGAFCIVRIVQANCVLAWRIWSPRLPIRPGMLVIPTEMATPGGMTAVGILSSVIVDNQLVDLDAAGHQLQYHAIWVDTTDPGRARQRITARIEGFVRGLEAPS